MKKLIIFALGATAGACLLYAGLTPFAGVGLAQGDKGLFTVSGKTKCIPGNKAIIAPVPLHPVEDIFVSVGDRVKKGDKLVRLDDDDQQADVRAKQAALEGAEIMLKEAMRLKESVDPVNNQGVLSAQRIHEILTNAKKAAADARQAKATLEAAKYELGHYTVEAPIDGIVNRLDVYLGTVSRPGTTIWGEILDLSEIDVACQLSLSQVEKLEAGQKSKLLAENGMRYFGQEADVLHKETAAKLGTGVVVFIGLEADANGNLPALVRFDNPDYKLRCEVPVQLRFTGTRNDKAVKEQEKKIEHRDKERKANEKKSDK
jgi:RND family efflux transporter MFP subunit